MRRNIWKTEGGFSGGHFLDEKTLAAPRALIHVNCNLLLCGSFSLAIIILE